MARGEVWPTWLDPDDGGQDVDLLVLLMTLIMMVVMTIVMMIMRVRRMLMRIKMRMLNKIRLISIIDMIFIYLFSV